VPANRRRRQPPEVDVKYLFLLYARENERPALGTPAGEEMTSDYAAAISAMSEAGVFVDCAPLEPLADAVTVQIRGEQQTVAENQAAPGVETVCGYTVVDCDGLEEALKWAATIPAARDGSVQVRPVKVVPAA
jgi:hypothetical protein